MSLLLRRYWHVVRDLSCESDYLSGLSAARQSGGPMARKDIRGLLGRRIRLDGNFPRAGNDHTRRPRR
jgi:hypothetical protein